MPQVKIFSASQGLDRSWSRGALAIGNFDGVHRGHAALISRLTQHAARVGGPAVIFTFAPHPGELLSPRGAPPPLCALERKVELLTELGVNGVWAYPTDQALLELDPDQFFRQIVVDQLQARVIVEGTNFCFGKDRAGNIASLRTLCEATQIELDVVAAEISGEGEISSSRIRERIQAGDVAAAHLMLTRPHRIAGRVVAGEARGRTLGFPTANIAQITTLVPAHGVYAGWAQTRDGAWPAAVHIGPNLTFGENHTKVEAHLIGFSGDLYHQRLEIDFLSQLRHIHPFPNVDALQRQLRDDVQRAKHTCESDRVAQFPILRPETLKPPSHLMPIDWPAFVQQINSHHRFVLTSHIRPDCDALGSELAMAFVLEELGKHVIIANGQATPPNLAFIDPEHRIRALHETIQLDELTDRDALLILDTSAWAQLGSMGEFVRATNATKMILDHHVSEDELGAIAFKDTTAEATGRLVCEAAEQLGVRLSRAMAIPLFAAMATDTGWFRFPSTNPESYRWAARLLEAGAEPAKIYGALYEQETVGRCRLRGIVLSRLQTELEGRFVHTYVLREDFAQAGAIPQDTEDAINLALSIAGTQFAVILVEQLQGGFKLSFRSRCALDCSQIAAQFGGGGHRAAAGAFINEPLEIAQPKVLNYVRQLLK